MATCRQGRFAKLPSGIEKKNETLLPGEYLIPQRAFEEIERLSTVEFNVLTAMYLRK